MENIGSSESCLEYLMNLIDVWCFFGKAGTVIVESWIFPESFSVMDKSETLEMGRRQKKLKLAMLAISRRSSCSTHISSNWAGSKLNLDLN